MGSTNQQYPRPTPASPITAFAPWLAQGLLGLVQGLHKAGVGMSCAIAMTPPHIGRRMAGDQGGDKAGEKIACDGKNARPGGRLGRQFNVRPRLRTHNAAQCMQKRRFEWPP
ncbi:hypothetical protein KZ686_16075 [Cupriavidus cauae]|uniref:Uncharacterized protein n=1 Tax=Cupriavidus cauae TaxID=2608999 RepID=A0A5M8AHC3_9BURK|nr:hypothetical protein [Cupriavidus cauae]KAA6123098.1 hypothetical protein F1599_14535 [Cupriavidus cauae]UZN51686.1 hypothetical protein KZ686_16075 [Cupriavidus cauae]